MLADVYAQQNLIQVLSGAKKVMRQGENISTDLSCTNIFTKKDLVSMIYSCQQDIRCRKKKLLYGTSKQTLKSVKSHETHLRYTFGGKELLPGKMLRGQMSQ